MDVKFGEPKKKKNRLPSQQHLHIRYTFYVSSHNPPKINQNFLKITGKKSKDIIFSGNTEGLCPGSELGTPKLALLSRENLNNLFSFCTLGSN